ncbi:DNA polymerase III subunit gamma/tau [Chloroflexota bacterium]
MESQVFYRKWRPRTLAEVVGQESVTQTLHNALSGSRISHAYLFCGPRGTGKTSTARILAKAVNCITEGNAEPCNTCQMCQAITEARALDVIEIDAASNTGVDDIRSLREKINYSPNQARYKVYIIDEVHMLSNSAANALLKTLEEPPPHVIFILATTEVHKILPTILSRCQRFDFRRISQDNIVSELSRVCQGEGIKIDTGAMQMIARSATGSLRDALNLLEQLTTYYSNDIGLEQVKTLLGITGDWRVRELVRQIITNDISAGVATINNVNNDGLDLRQFNRELVEYFRGLLLVKTGSDEAVDLVAEDMIELKELADGTSLEQILRTLKLFGQLEIGFDNYPTLPMELALIDCILASDGIEVNPDKQTVDKSPQTPKTVVSSPVVPAPGKPENRPVPDKVPEAEPVRQEDPGVEPSLDRVAEVEPVREEVHAEEPSPDDVPAPEPVISADGNLPLDAGSEIERLKVNWKQVIEQAPKDTRKTPAIAILRSAGVTPVAIENDTVSLAFRYPLIKEQIEKVENQHVAEKIISNFLGRPCRVTCVLEDNHLLKEALKIGKHISTEEK